MRNIDSALLKIKIMNEKEPIIMYPYRSARITNVLLWVSIQDDEYLDIVNSFAKAATILYDNFEKKYKVVEAGTCKPDNHIVFKVGKAYYMITDGNLGVATDIEIQSW